MTELATVKPENDSLIRLTLPKNLVTDDTDHIDFCPDFFKTGTDNNGYMVLPRGTKEGCAILCRFHERPDTEYINDSNMLPMWGYKTITVTYVAVVTGMAW